MKKLFYSLLGLTFAFAACNTDPVGIDFTPEAPESRTDVVPIDEALGQLDAVMNAIAQSTRSEAFDYTRTIREIQVSGGALATRNGESDLPDTMAYVVNFTDDKGFAVLGAQRTLEPVYAITESGSFDASKLNDAIARAEKRRQNPVPDTRSEEKDQIYTDIGTDFAYELLAEAMVAQPRIAPDTLQRTYGEWETNPSIGPIVEVKWDQTYPFNMAMDLSQFHHDAPNYGKYPVGCGVVAAAQIMATTLKPARAPLSSTSSFNWAFLKTVSKYSNSDLFAPNKYPNGLTSTTRLYTERLASVLAYLGKQYFNAESDASGTGTGDEDIINGLKLLDPVYYAKVKVMDMTASTYDQIRYCIENNKPIYCSGYHWKDVWYGHAWVIDGYFSQTRTVTTTIRYGYTGPIQTFHGTETKYFLHFNWGYRGSCDGYFAQGIFDMSKRISTDEIIDQNTTTIGGKNYGYYVDAILY